MLKHLYPSFFQSLSFSARVSNVQDGLDKGFSLTPRNVFSVCVECKLIERFHVLPLGE